MFEHLGVDPKLVSVTLVTDLIPVIRNMFLSTNGLSEITAILGITRDPRSGESLGGMQLLLLRDRSDLGLDGSNQGKTKFTQILKVMAERSEATFLAILSEIWTVKSSEDLAETKAIKDWVALHRDISQCPYRQEAVMIQLEHQRSTPRHQLWVAPIKEDSSGVRTVGEFVREEHEGYSGRFANLLPNPVDETLPPKAQGQAN
jgi:hypothetical protein